MLGIKILEEKKSKYNGSLRVVKTWGMGTYIQANGLTQSGGVVEGIWNQTLRKIQDSRFKIQDILILGLGGGTAAKLIRKNWPNAKITGVDIDPIMVELGQRYLEFNENEVEVKIQDASDYLTNHQSQTTSHFDLAIVDLYNGDKFPDKFATNNFLRLIHKLLTENGKAIFNRLYQGSNWPSSAYFKDKKREAEKFARQLEKIYTKVERFRPEANIMFICYNK